MRKNEIDSHLSQFNKKGIPQANSTWTLARFYILRSAFVFLIFAMSQPIYGKKKVKGTVKSMELVVCLDVSNSMNTMDIEQTPRIEVAKRALNALVNTLAGEKIGLCIFAGNAYVQLPLTTDYNAAKLFINDVTTDFVSNQGTNISDALSVSNGMFSKENVTKAIFVITDGENHEEENKEIYEEIIENNIQVCVLGIGTSTGGTIPINPSYLGEGYITNSVGQRVVSRMNPGFVKQIASQTNGVAMITSEAYPDLQTLLTQINQMKRTKLRDLEFDIEETRYQLPLFVSLICFVIWLFMPMLKDLRSKK
jgi:Ca-activated chloride channel family protein